MEMKKFHPKHLKWNDIFMQIICLLAIVWIGYKYGGENMSRG